MNELTVIIPTLNAENNIKKLLTSVNAQTITPKTIILIDSESDDKTVDIARTFSNVETRIVKKTHFDHGRTRDAVMREVSTEYAILLTQDVTIKDRHTFEILIENMNQNHDVVVSYARQEAYEDANIIEKLIREFNYPQDACIKDKSMIADLGIKTFFCSNSCAAYRVKEYKDLGGFLHPINTNEDMFFAATAINNGYKISYVADAVVKHSHCYSLKQQFYRNYYQGYEMQKNKELIHETDSLSEGFKLAGFVIKRLITEYRIISLLQFGVEGIVRLWGNTAGKRAYIRNQ